MRRTIIVISALILAGCGPSGGGGSRSAQFTLDSSQLTLYEGDPIRIPFDASAGPGQFSFEPADTILVRAVGDELVVQVAEDITDIEYVSGSVVHTLDANTAKVPVNVTLMPETRISMTGSEAVVAMSGFSESSVRFDLNVEPTSQIGNVEVSVGSDTNGVSAFVENGQLVFRAGELTQTGVHVLSVELTLNDVTKSQSVTFDLTSGVEPDVYKLAGALLTNKAFSDVRGDDSELLYFYADLAYLAGSITQSERDDAQSSCFQGQSNLVGSVVTAREQLHDTYRRVESGSMSLISLDASVNDYTDALGALADNTTDCINNFVATNISSGVPSLPSNGLEIKAASVDVYRGSSDYGYEGASGWVFNSTWAFMEALGY